MKEVVIVQGLGFVGCAVAAVLADAMDDQGEACFDVIGLDIATPGGLARVEALNAGNSPVDCPDPQLELCIRKGKERSNLRATTDAGVMAEADVIVVDLPLDVQSRTASIAEEIEVDLSGYKQAMSQIAESMKPDALVVIESTVPVGMTEKVVQPILEQGRRERGLSEPLLLAHCYERVMPGPRYVDSIRKFWRVYSGVNAASRKRVQAFLKRFIDTDQFPLTELNATGESELAKVMENSYRAMNIAWIQEWTELAEKLGLDLFSVIEAIRVRQGTHDNIRYPGFGVGGYCLTKDAYFAAWGALNLHQASLPMPLTFQALEVNYQMPRHTWKCALECAGEEQESVVWGIAGISYLADLDDTRNSPVEVLVEAMEEKGASFELFDPCLEQWPERPDLTLYSREKEFFSRIGGLILTVGHRLFKEWDYMEMIKQHPQIRFIVDAWNLVDDATAEKLVAAGIQVIGVGKGHWRGWGYHLKK
ncbi:MAG: nucleotide sugar dehydrogenase [Verrucomicrobiota bacterium]